MDKFSRTRLNNGVEIPWIGLGVFRTSSGHEGRQAIQAALEAGYRHIDTAAFYGNEHTVGEAVRASGLSREEVFITTKLWNSDHGYDRAQRALDQSLQELGLETVDLYLIHWPVEGKRRDSWRALEKILAEGKARAIGVSNYMPQHLHELENYANVIPAVNQIELHPFNYRSRENVVALCQEMGIVVEAYSPLTKARRLDDPRLLGLADRYEKTPAQVLIRYILQKEIVVLPKSANPGRIRENINVFDFELSQADMAYLDRLDEALATSWDPTEAP